LENVCRFLCECEECSLPHKLQALPHLFFYYLFIYLFIPDPGGKKLPTIIEKSEEISCFEVLDVLFFKTFGHQNPGSTYGSACGSALA
jgi:hypothetical protein